ncbi:MAG: portal protein, partial [Alphaproteobacteria bacterium]|nr:portal protein [Alphaproteobacteria bacterium]
MLTQPTINDAAETVARLNARFATASTLKDAWLPLWQECYQYSLPNRVSSVTGTGYSRPRMDQVYDGTAADAVDQLASSMLSQLTPPWARWFGFSPGSQIPADDQPQLGAALDEIADVMQNHFDLSNFAIEAHQCYLDLVTVGTACLMFEPAPLGDTSAFKFTAVPLCQLALLEGPGGRLDTVFRASDMTLAIMDSRFHMAQLPENLREKLKKDQDSTVQVIEAVVPTGFGDYEYTAYIRQDNIILCNARLPRNPFICFRWLKAPGEVYGRSPVMKALPDIKTANKVVELVLKNATIAVTGIWQAEDDGILNPANIKLVPGAIIPKAAGSKGLTPLEAPGKFDVSQLMLNDMRARINHALLADQLTMINQPMMSATEVLERSAAMARILGATYGRLQSEFLTPLLMQAISILMLREEIPLMILDGTQVKL